jgi:hypothetical protein
MVVLGEAMSHPSSGKLTTEQLDEIGKLADEALDLEKKSDGKEWWRTLEPKSNTTLFRILKLKGLVDGRTKVRFYSEMWPFVYLSILTLDTASNNSKNKIPLSSLPTVHWMNTSLWEGVLKRLRLQLSWP